MSTPVAASCDCEHLIADLPTALAHVSVDSNGCWIWTGRARKKGYATMTWRGRHRYYAHRAAYEWAHGPIPGGLEIDHLCCLPLCVNPSHLEAVTGIENRRRALRNCVRSGGRFQSQGREVRLTA